MAKSKLEIKLRERKSFLQRKARNIEWLFTYKQQHPCVDCGEADPIVLHFDHVNGKKIGAVGYIKDGSSLERLKKEVSKCEIRCANCHLRKTAKQFNWHNCLNLNVSVLHHDDGPLVIL